MPGRHPGHDHCNDTAMIRGPVVSLRPFRHDEVETFQMGDYHDAEIYGLVRADWMATRTGGGP